MRFPLTIDIDSRDGISNKDARCFNTLVETDGAAKIVATRPGLTSYATSSAVVGQGLYCFNNVLIAIKNGLLYKPAAGAFGSSTSLPSASTTAQFDFTQSPT